MTTSRLHSSFLLILRTRRCEISADKAGQGSYTVDSGPTRQWHTREKKNKRKKRTSSIVANSRVIHQELKDDDALRELHCQAVAENSDFLHLKGVGKAGRATGGGVRRVRRR